MEFLNGLWPILAVVGFFMLMRRFGGGMGGCCGMSGMGSKTQPAPKEGEIERKPGDGSRQAVPEAQSHGK